MNAAATPAVASTMAAQKSKMPCAVGAIQVDRPQRDLPDGGPQADDEEDGEDRRLRKDVEDGMKHGHHARVAAWFRALIPAPGLS